MIVDGLHRAIRVAHERLEAGEAPLLIPDNSSAFSPTGPTRGGFTDIPARNASLLTSHGDTKAAILAENMSKVRKR